MRNKLEIAVPADNPAKVDDLKDLTDPKVKVALCAEQVPCGAAAVKALDAAGLKVTPVTLEQDVKATLTKVELGEVDAALVYKTDVLAAAGKVQGIDFPEADKAINDYPIATLTKAPRRRPGPAVRRPGPVAAGQGRADQGRLRGPLTCDDTTATPADRGGPVGAAPSGERTDRRRAGSPVAGAGVCPSAQSHRD